MLLRSQFLQNNIKMLFYAFQLNSDCVANTRVSYHLIIETKRNLSKYIVSNILLQ